MALVGARRLLGLTRSQGNGSYASLAQARKVLDTPVHQTTGTVAWATTSYDQLFGMVAFPISGHLAAFVSVGTSNGFTVDGVTVMRTSTDGGLTWSAPVTPSWGTPPTGKQVRNLAVGVTPTGRLNVVYTVWGGVANTDWTMFSTYSDDEGVTWSTPVTQTAPAGLTTVSAYGPIIVTDDPFNGNLLAGAYGWTTGGAYSVFVWKSSDNGATWGAPITVVSGGTTGGGTDYTETSFVYLGGSRVLALARADHATNRRLRQFYSADNGATWTDHGAVTFDTTTGGANAVNAWLTSSRDLTGKRVITAYFVRNSDTNVCLVQGTPSALSAGVSGWISATVVTSGQVGYYPAAVHPSHFPAALVLFSHSINAGDQEQRVWVASSAYSQDTITPQAVQTVGAVTAQLGASTQIIAGAFSGRPGISFGTGTLTLILCGSGTPEAAAIAPPGSLFLRTDGGAGTSLYVKESGTGNTGWVGK